MARLIVIVVLLVASSFGLNAQNLVLNPSFEQIDTCYRDAFGGDHYIAKNWTDPDHNSSDFFHPCAPNYFFGSVPDNAYGFQYPRTGLSYAGFVFTLDLDPNSQLKANAEYNQGQLKKPLQPGHKYKLRFYYSLARDNVCWTNSVTNNLGVTFTDTFTNTPYYFSSTFLPKPTLLYSNFLDSDDVYWHPMEFTFTATQTANYFIVGFMDTATMKFHKLNDCNNKVKTLYLYVDDFSLVDLTNPQAEIPEYGNVFTPNNDGKNDTYLTYWEVDPPEIFHLRIYNRWGEKLFDTQDPLYGWDGTTNGSVCPEGTYFALIEYATIDGEKRVTTPVVLLR